LKSRNWKNKREKEEDSRRGRKKKKATQGWWYFIMPCHKNLLLPVQGERRKTWPVKKLDGEFQRKKTRKEGTDEDGGWSV